MSLLNLTLSSALASDIGWTLVHFLWQGAVLAALLEAILPLCRSAVARHNWALAILTAMVAAPVVTFVVLHHQGATDLAPVMRTAAPAALPSGPSVGFVAAPLPWTGWLVALWLTGIALLGLRALGGLMVARGLRHSGAKPPAHLLPRCFALQLRLKMTWPVRFLQSHAVTAPLVVGWLRPVILIPVAAIASLPPQQLDALILHELAHISRLDAFTNLFLILAETVLFYHPAIWWVSRRIRIEREHCCDDIAVAQSGDAGAYAEALTALEMGRMPAFALSARGGQLRTRVARLLDVPQTRRNSAPAAALVATALIAAAIVLPALAQPKPIQPKQVKDATVTITDDTDTPTPLRVEADKMWHHSAPGSSDPNASTDFSGHVVLIKGDLQFQADSGHAEGPDGKPSKVTLDGNVTVTDAGKRVFCGNHADIEMLDHAMRIKISPPMPECGTKQGANSPPALIKVADSAPPQQPRTPQPPRDKDGSVAVSVITSMGALRIQADMQKLADNGLTLEALRGVIANSGNVIGINDIAGIVLAYNKNGAPVRVADVATLAYTGPLDQAQEAQLHAQSEQARARVFQADQEQALARAQAEAQLQAKLAQMQAARASTITVEAALRSVSLTLSSDGAVSWNGTKIDDATLAGNFRKFAAEKPSMAFVLRADPGVSAQRLQAVVGTAISQGVTWITVQKAPFE